MMSLLNPSFAARMRSQELRSEKSHYQRIMQQAVDWRDDMPWQKELVICGESFRPSLTFPEVPIARPNDPVTNKIWGPHITKGDLGYANREYPAGRSADLMRGGKVWFTAPVVVPTLFENCADGPHPWIHGAVIMSLMPMELFSMRQGVRLAKGKVVIGGLGLGELLRQVCAKKSVTEVVVVERRQNLLDWFGYRLCRAQPKVKDVICGDAFEHLGKHGMDARYLMDVWNDYGGNKEDWQVQEAQKKHPGLKVWCWG